MHRPCPSFRTPQAIDIFSVCGDYAACRPGGVLGEGGHHEVRHYLEDAIGRISGGDHYVMLPAGAADPPLVGVEHRKGVTLVEYLRASLAPRRVRRS